MEKDIEWGISLNYWGKLIKSRVCVSLQSLAFWIEITIQPLHASKRYFSYLPDLRYNVFCFVLFLIRRSVY